MQRSDLATSNSLSLSSTWAIIDHLKRALRHFFKSKEGSSCIIFYLDSEKTPNHYVLLVKPFPFCPWALSFYIPAALESWTWDFEIAHPCRESFSIRSVSRRRFCTLARASNSYCFPVRNYSLSIGTILVHLNSRPPFFNCFEKNQNINEGMVLLQWRTEARVERQFSK